LGGGRLADSAFSVDSDLSHTAPKFLIILIIMGRVGTGSGGLGPHSLPDGWEEAPNTEDNALCLKGLIAAVLDRTVLCYPTSKQ
jgi:hypothetical protein